MDSLTQIVLGASMGEAIGGRKLGNRAMVIGGIVGTIPDLDVMARLFGMSDINALAFHRAISHSLAFSVIAPIVYTLLAYFFYDKMYHKSKNIRWIYAVLAFLFLLGVSAIINVFPLVLAGSVSIITIVLSTLLIGILIYRLVKKYVYGNPEIENLSLGHWYLLFFIATITHPILDCCTAYGTQIFQPFSDLRVSWHNISVVDPLFTFPFLIFLLIAAFYNRKGRKRTIFNLIGIAWGLLYLAYTVKNKLHVNHVFEESLEKQEIQYERYLTTPTIFNNLLWHCIAEGDSVYYDGMYSIYDEDKNIEIQEIDKNHELIDFPNSHEFTTLKWFSGGYYNVFDIGGDTLQMNDMRYGLFVGGDKNNHSDYIFKFLLIKEGNEYRFEESRERPDFDRSDLLKMWNRMMGKQ